jgi:hypothetical protein
MIPPQHLRDRLHEQPFRPFRIHISDGRTFDVRHPELLMVGIGTATLGIPQAGATEPFYERTVTLSLLHMTTTEYIEADQGVQGNGHQ